jgi:Rieske Fe-S protein
MDRRTVLTGLAGVGMALGLSGTAAGLAGIAAQFLYPSKGRPTAWVFVAIVGEVAVGAALPFTGPLGEKIAIARQGEAGTVEDFIALSSTCPHLGCQVHWESVNNRFFCPCHNGAFDPSGVATEGPPAKAKQSLSRYPLKITDGLLFIEVPVPTQAG